MDRVFKALDQRLQEEVALKLINPEIAADQRIMERFRNELKLARKTSQKHIGRMYETFRSVWKEADPEPAKVADAKARMAKENGS